MALPPGLPDPSPPRMWIAVAAVFVAAAAIMAVLPFLAVPLPGGGPGTASSKLPSAPATLGSLPYRVNAAGVAAVGDEVVLAGGVQNSTIGPIDLATILVYNETTGTSRVSAQEFPMPRRGAMAFADGPDVYILGGFAGGSTYLSDIWAYSPTNDSLWFVGSLPGPRCYGAVAFDGSRAYVVGGISAYGVYASSVFAFDPSTGTSSALSVSLPSGLWGDSAVYSHGMVYVFGGFNETNVSAAILAFAPSQDGIARVIGSLPTPLATASAVLDGDAILLSGGKETYLQTPPVITSDVFVFRPLVDKTTVLANALPAPRFEHGSVLTASGLLILGGRDAYGAAMATVFLVSVSLS